MFDQVPVLSSSRWMRMPLALLLVLGLLFTATPQADAKDAPPAREPQDATAADESLEQLGKMVRKHKKLNNETIFAYLDETVTAYRNFEMPEAPAEDASEDEKKEYEKAKKKIETMQDKHAKKASKLFFKCLTMTKLDRSGKTNERDNLNIRTAELLIGLAPSLSEDERKDFTKDTIKAIGSLEKVKHDIDTTHMEKMFEMLAAFDHTSALDYILKEHVHAVNTPAKLTPMQGAHKALPKFKTRPGKYRYDVVENFIKVYSSVESQANQNDGSAASQAKKEFWDKISVDVIKVLQVYAGDSATNPETGAAFAEVKEFQDWFRKNKNKNKAPWKDPKS